jgi:hypothetical protein
MPSHADDTIAREDNRLEYQRYKASGRTIVTITIVINVAAESGTRIGSVTT